MIIKYRSNFYKIMLDETVRIGTYKAGNTWSYYNDEKVINNVLLCGEVINR